MLKLRKIAVTGGVASGKSTVCAFFHEWGASVVSADKIVHHLLSNDQQIIRQLTLLFGAGILADGIPDRGAIARRVFNHPQLLKSLESLLHPAVIASIEDNYRNACEEGNAALFVAEVPLLYEVGYDDAFDAVVFVDAPPEVCRQRFIQQGGDAEDFARRCARFLPSSVKRRRAHYVIDNDGNMAQLQKAARRVYEQV